MLTAMQSSKLTACTKLAQAIQLINECRSLICLGKDQTRLLSQATSSLDQVVAEVAPSNEGPKGEPIVG